MDLRKLKTLIDLVAESGISELEVTEENDKVRIVNKVQTVAVAAPAICLGIYSFKECGEKAGRWI